MIDICKKSKEEKVNELNQNYENKINRIKEENEKLKVQIQYYESEMKKYKNEINRLNSEVYERKKLNDQSSKVAKENEILKMNIENLNEKIKN